MRQCEKCGVPQPECEFTCNKAKVARVCNSCQREGIRKRTAKYRSEIAEAIRAERETVAVRLLASVGLTREQVLETRGVYGT